MVAVETPAGVAQIGETAGILWHLLADAETPVSLAQLVKRAGVPRDTVMQAVGWLAREDKIQIEENGRTKYVSLA